MKKILLMITLMISVAGFSQNAGKEFLQNRNSKNESLRKHNLQSFKDMDFQSKDIYLQALTKKRLLTTPQTNPQDAMKQCLDSIIGSSYKRVFSYDNRGNTILDASYFRGTEIGTQKTEYLYDNNGNQIMLAFYEWCAITNNKWIPSHKYESTYDNNGSPITEIVYYWNDEINDWELSPHKWKYENTYNNNGKLIEAIAYKWDHETSDWKLRFKVDFAYDNNDNEILYVYYNRDDETNDWIGSYKVENTYDNNGNRTIFATYGWSNEINDWSGSGKRKYTYDNNNNLTLYLFYSWDDTTNDWETEEGYKSKFENTYDNNSNLTMRIHYRWDSYNNDWFVAIKKEAVFDLSYFKTDLIFPPMLFYNIDYEYDLDNALILDNAANMLTEVLFYDLQFEYEVPILYFWSAKNITNVSEITKDYSSVRIYPNPVSNILHVETEETNKVLEVKIYSIQGVLLLTAKGEQIDVSSLASGIYIVNVNGMSRKIVKQ